MNKKPATNETHRTCKRCNETFPIEDFPLSPTFTLKDGSKVRYPLYKCKKCKYITGHSVKQDAVTKPEKKHNPNGHTALSSWSEGRHGKAKRGKLAQDVAVIVETVTARLPETDKRHDTVKRLMDMAKSVEQGERAIGRAGLKMLENDLTRGRG